jgi:hypothetical protein
MGGWLMHAHTAPRIHLSQGPHRPSSVFDLVGRGEPGGKACPGLIRQHLFGRQSASGRFLTNFVVEESVVKTRPRRIRRARAKIYGVQSRPMRRCKAHGARLTACVECAAGQCEGAQRLAGRANRVHFAVRRWIICRGDRVCALAHDLPILHNYCAKRATLARHDILSRECNRTSQELGIWYAGRQKLPLLFQNGES